MKDITSKCLFFWAIVHLISCVALAQESSVSVRTLQLSSGVFADSWVREVGEKKPVKLSWLTTQPTEPLQLVTQGGKLQLMRASSGEQEKTVFDVVTTIALPPGAKEVLILGWSSEEGERHVALKDHFLQANFDDWIAINTSITPVAVRVGRASEPVRVEPGKSVNFKPRIQEGTGVEMIAMAPRDGKPKTFLSTYWPAFKGQRTMIVFFQDGDRMRARRISDRLPIK